MKNKSLLLIGSLFITLALTMVGCGSSSGSSSNSGSNIDSVADLPSATDRVESGADASISRASVRALGSSAVGMPLGSITNSSFDATMSLAACEMFNMTKTAINQAALGDLILCYISNTFDAFADTQGINIYDGEYHVFTLDFTGTPMGEEDEGGPDHIKFKIAKNSTSGAITEFEMFSCSSGTQNEYISQTISGTSFNLTSAGTGTQAIEGMGTMTWTDGVTVAGTLNSSGQFVDEVNGTATPKTIHMQHSNVVPEANQDFWGDLNFSQYSDNATLVGTMSGTNTWQETPCTFTNNIYSSVSLLDTNAANANPYVIGLLELGNGAAKFDLSGNCGEDTWEDTNTTAWDGGTALDLGDPTQSSHYPNVVNQTLTTADEPTTGFTANQTYNCGDTSEMTIVFANLGIDIDAACSHLQLGHNHIDCWHIMGNEDE